jgi:hypothetical protein
MASVNIYVTPETLARYKRLKNVARPSISQWFADMLRTLEMDYPELKEKKNGQS